MRAQTTDAMCNSLTSQASNGSTTVVSTSVKHVKDFAILLFFIQYFVQIYNKTLTLFNVVQK